MPRPIFMLVADDEPRREALHRDLSRRYEADYEVISVVPRTRPVRTGFVTTCPASA